MGITVRGAPPRCQYARVPGPAGARHAHSDPGLPQAPVFTAPETQVACGHTPNSGPCRYLGCCDNHKAPVQAPAKKPPLVVNPADPQAYRSILRAHTREPDAPNPWLTRRQIAQGAWDAGRWSFCRLTCVVKKEDRCAIRGAEGAAACQRRDPESRSRSRGRWHLLRSAVGAPDADTAPALRRFPHVIRIWGCNGILPNDRRVLHHTPNNPVR